MVNRPAHRIIATIFFSSLISVCITADGGAWAQEWKPQSNVEIVVPNTPGGGNDGLARLMQKNWTSQRLLEAPSTVLNKPGGAGNVALAYISQRTGDGHFMSIVSVTQQLNYIVGTSKYNHKDFTPLATLIGDFVAYAVRADSSLQSAKDVIERLKKDPGSLTFGVTSVGGNNHIALVLAMRSAGVNAAKLKTPVFQSSGDSLSALLGGHIDVHVGSVGPVRAHLESGGVRLVAVSSDHRLAGAFAQTPTWKEQGINGTFSTWRGIWGPSRMTPGQIGFWDQVLGKFSQSEEWKQTLDKYDWTNDYRNSRDAQKYLDAINEQLKDVLKELGLAKNL